MQVKSIAECSNGSILQYFRPALSYHLSLRSVFCLFLSGRLRQVLLYDYIARKIIQKWEHSGSVVECLKRDRGAAGSSLNSVTAIWSLSKTYFCPSFVLVQPRKTHPCLTERLLMGRKESNQTNNIQKYF